MGDKRYGGDSDKDVGVKRHGKEGARRYGGENDMNKGVRRDGQEYKRRNEGDSNTNMGVRRYEVSKYNQMRMIDNGIEMSKHKELNDDENRLISYDDKSKLKETSPYTKNSRAAGYHNEKEERRYQKQRERRQGGTESERHRKHIPTPSDYDYDYDNEDYYDYEYYDRPELDPKPTI